MKSAAEEFKITISPSLAKYCQYLEKVASTDCVDLQDEKVAQNELQTLSDGGNAVAKYYLWKTFSKSDQKDIKQKGIDFLNAAATAGYAPAQCELGLYCLKDHEGAQKDEKQAVKWLERASQQNYLEGEIELGDCHFYGRGTIEDKEKAFACYNKLAARGNTRAKFEAGYCYLYGIGVAVDQKKGFRLLQDAASEGHQTARLHLAHCYSSGNGVAVNQEQAVKEYQELAREGVADAKAEEGRCYVYGLGVSSNPELGISLLKEAVAKGSVLAEEFLANILLFGVNGVGKDEKQGVQYAQKNAAKGRIQAQYLLGLIHLNGCGDVKKDEEKAFTYFQTATNPELAQAQNFDVKQAEELLARCYEEGRGTSKNEKLACYWYEAAANNGSPNAQAKVGEYYRDGKGVAANPIIAMRWFARAANQNHSQASLSLIRLCIKENDFLSGRPRKILAKIKKDLKQMTFHRMLAAQLPSVMGLCIYFPKNIPPELGAIILSFLMIKPYGDENDCADYDSLKTFFSHEEKIKTPPEEGMVMMQNEGSLHHKAGVRLKEGKEVAKDIKAAIEHFEQGVELDDPASQYELACCYAEGIGVNVNLEKARELLQESAEQDYVYSLFQLGRCYRFGLWDSPTDIEKAIFYFQKAAEQSERENINIGAQCALAEYFRIHDITKAMYWSAKASNLGDAKSKVTMVAYYNLIMKENISVENKFDSKEVAREQPPLFHQQLAVQIPAIQGLFACSFSANFLNDNQKLMGIILSCLMISAYSDEEVLEEVGDDLGEKRVRNKEVYALQRFFQSRQQVAIVASSEIQEPNKALIKGL